MIKSEYENMGAQDQSHWWFLGMTAIIDGVLQRYYRGRSGLSILDAGSGTCWLVPALSKYGRVSALDIEPEALRICRERGVKETIQADIQNIPLPPASFDLIVCSEVLYHMYITSDVAVMRGLHRLLRPGGRVLIKIPAHAYLSGEHDKVNLTRERYEMKQVRKLILETGFELDFISYANFFLLPLVFLKRKSEKLLRSKPESDIKKTFAPLNLLLTLILRLEGKLLSRIRLPEGSSIIAVGRRAQ